MKYSIVRRVNCHRCAIRKNQTRSQFALYLNGELIGLYSRCRDAVRAYRHSLRKLLFSDGDCRSVESLPAWIELTAWHNCESVVKYLSGLGFQTRKQQLSVAA